jgi:hypothetical protein
MLLKLSDYLEKSIGLAASASVTSAVLPDSLSYLGFISRVAPSQLLSSPFVPQGQVITVLYSSY